MRKLLLAGLVLAMVTSVAGALPGVPTAAVDLVFDNPGVAGVVSSDNVNYHGTIPLDSPGVGGEVVHREDLNKTFFYATGLKGLSIYDVTNPALPVLAGHLPFQHAQNEDLKVSDDGKTAVIAADGSILVPVAPVTVGVTVVDVSNPASPQIVASSNARVMGQGTSAGQAEHTAECADADCSVIYGRTGRIYEVDREAGTVTENGRWNEGEFITADGSDVVYSAGGIHALNRDESGLVISDSHPRLVLDPRDNPLEPTVLSYGWRAPGADNRLQHNNVRTGAREWKPRDPEAPVETRTIDSSDLPAYNLSVTDERPVMRPGELMVGNAETNLNPTCSTAGGLSTWSMVNFDQGEQMQQLEVFRPVNGDPVTEGRPPANGLGCSGHWFTVTDNFVTASWYEHGVRFFELDMETGTIDEVGWFQPIATEAGAAYWIDDEFVYSVDYARGIDILSFDRSEDLRPTQAELDASWLVNLGRVGPLAAAERMFCALAVED